MNPLLEVVARHRAGEPVGIYSVCSANPLVIQAALVHARAADRPALIEATSNQVNQYGGYTGMRPKQFRDAVLKIADEVAMPHERIVLGGDHLGPHCWRMELATEALAQAEQMISEYCRTGFRKIHLDCSMPCRDDPRPLPDEIIAERTAALCAGAEAAARSSGGELPLYVIGSEVPAPGGAQTDLHDLEVTRPEAASRTLDAHRIAFARRGLEAAWQRVIGLVVQPGVEFDDSRVIDYSPGNARGLRACLAPYLRLVFEAHSTDYQTTTALRALVRDHFAILKVGPALTFALREAVWALDHIEREWLGPEKASQVRDTILAAMRRDPTYWATHYRDTGRDLGLKLEYSLSDRIRYYWPVAEVRSAMSRLAGSFERATPPLALLHQYLPGAYAAVRAGEVSAGAQDLLMYQVRQVLTEYASACDQRHNPGGC